MFACIGMPLQLSFLSLPKIQAYGQFSLFLFLLEFMLVLFWGCFSVLQQSIVLDILRYAVTDFF